MTPTGTFTATPDVTYPHCQSTSAQLSDGSDLIVGSIRYGFGPLPGAEIYDRETGVFSHTGAMTTGRDYPKATLLTSGQVLLTGGPGASAELYNPPLSMPPPVLLSVSGGVAEEGAILHADTHHAVSAANYVSR